VSFWTFALILSFFAFALSAGCACMARLPGGAEAPKAAVAVAAAAIRTAVAIRRCLCQRIALLLGSIAAVTAQGLRSSAVIPGPNDTVGGNNVAAPGILESEGVFLQEPHA
jgi:hypothetical protein